MNHITGAMIDRAIYSDANHNRYVHLLRQLIDRKLTDAERQAFEAIQRCKELARLGENIEAELRDMEAQGNALLLAALLIRREQKAE